MSGPWRSDSGVAVSEEPGKPQLTAGEGEASEGLLRVFLPHRGWWWWCWCWWRRTAWSPRGEKINGYVWPRLCRWFGTAEKRDKEVELSRVISLRLSPVSTRLSLTVKPFVRLHSINRDNAWHHMWDINVILKVKFSSLLYFSIVNIRTSSRSKMAP